jgi:Uma2 family endonuclease
MNILVRPARPIPPLENGDRLTREEFERRYEAMPDVRAELVEGVVYMSSPVSHEFHGGPHADLMTWAGVYKASTPGTSAADNTTVRLDLDNEPQPDVLLFVRPDHGGRVALTDGYVHGAPELVAEVSASTASLDLGMKLNVYRRNQVAEYVVWRVYDDALDWFVLRAGQFVPLAPDPADGLLKSETFPGLWLDPAALLRRDLAAVLAALTRGLATPDHAAFAARLAAARRTP